MTRAVVMRLVDPMKERGHRVYLDNYYTSPQLFADLQRNGFRACGTMRLNRRGTTINERQREKGGVGGSPIQLIMSQLLFNGGLRGLFQSSPLSTMIMSYLYRGVQGLCHLGERK